ncbi:MAG: hydrolase 1, exosortase A system-associated [Roseateles depolymerans]|uniref:Hydrolase 1, exosortase A system-associated n=1 Tax=Roseateles depolymerans TaxID=76731 RepID=A0A2W5DG22_9BURK|nr:MAG: hydrolase 1, exosortase A system-associated [Roseateles depolymerans]
MKESVLRFECGIESLVGILAEPTGDAAELGVVIVVGGPQYRAGSHRQFTLLARHLAAHGHAVLRFDYRSMGDSTGEPRDFLGVDDDIAAAITALLAARPTLKQVALWGLCDAASAILLYLNAHRDPRVAGIALLNPWVRSTASLARTHVKHYYWRRLRDKSFWLKLLRGGVGWTALRGLGGNLKLAGSERRHAGNGSFQDRMALGLKAFPGPALLILSGDDYVAKEFCLREQESPAWAGLLQAERLTRHDLPEADHTFSDLQQSAKVETMTLNWLTQLRTLP